MNHRPPYVDSATGLSYNVSNPVRQGWLTKQTEWFKSWRRRYFMLQGSKLFFAKSESCAPHGMIDLKDPTLTVKCVNHKTGKKNSIEIGIKGCPMAYVFADTEIEKDMWISAIGRAIVSSQSTDNSESIPSNSKIKSTPTARSVSSVHTDQNTSATKANDRATASQKSTLSQPPIVMAKTTSNISRKIGDQFIGLVVANNDRNAIHKMLADHKPNEAELLAYRNRDGDTALIMGCKLGNDSAVSALLLHTKLHELMPDGRSVGLHAMQAAAEGDKGSSSGVSIIRDLLNRGVRLHGEKDGADAWLIAAKTGDLATMQEMLATSGWKRPALLVHAREDGETALATAFLHGQASVATWLLDPAQGQTLEGHIKVNGSFITLLILACKKGNIMCARMLLRFGARPNSPDGDFGETALISAADNGNVEIVQLLLEHGADPNILPCQGSGALHQAAANGHVAVVALLLEYGALTTSLDSVPFQFKKTPLVLAAEKKHSEVIALLNSHETAVANNTFVQKIPAPPCYTPKDIGEAFVAAASSNGDHTAATTVNTMLKKHGTGLLAYSDAVGETALIKACRAGYSMVVKDMVQMSLLKHDLIPAKPLEAMKAAAESGHPNASTIVNTLLEAGINLDGVKDGASAWLSAAAVGDLPSLKQMYQTAGWKQQALLHYREKDVQTAFVLACEHNHGSVVEWMITLGCSVESRLWPTSNTQLIRACQLGNLAYVQLLFRFGANVNKPDSGYGETALFHAAGGGYLAIVKLLLKKGAHVNIPVVNMLLKHQSDVKNKDNKTPLMVAQKKKKHGGVVLALEKHAAEKIDDYVEEEKAHDDLKPPPVDVKVLAPAVAVSSMSVLPPVQAESIKADESKSEPPESQPASTTSSADVLPSPPRAIAASLPEISLDQTNVPLVPQFSAISEISKESLVANQTQETSNADLPVIPVSSSTQPPTTTTTSDSTPTENISAHMQSMLSLQPQLLSLLSSSQRLQTLSQASPQTLQHLRSLGDSGQLSDKQNAYILSDPALQEYFVSFIQAVTSAVLASQTIASRMVADTRTSLIEKCSEFISFDKVADWMHLAGSSVGIPFASIATGICKYFIQLPYDIARTHAIQRVTKAFPSVSSHQLIETLARELTLLMQDEIRSIASSPTLQRTLWEKAKRAWEWLQTYDNATSVAAYAATHATMLIAGLCKCEEPPFTVQLCDLERLIMWAIDNRDRIGDFAVAELLVKVRAGDLLCEKDGNQPVITSTTMSSTQLSMTVEYNHTAVSAATSTSSIQETTVQVASKSETIAALMAEVAAMKERERQREEEHAALLELQRQRDAENAFQKSESEKSKKKLEAMEKQMKKLSVISDVFGRGEMLTAQNQESMHEVLSKHLDKSARAFAVVDQLVVDMLIVKEHVSLDDTRVDTQSVKEAAKKTVESDKNELFRK